MRDELGQNERMGGGTRKSWFTSVLMRRALWAPTLLLLLAYLILHGASNMFFFESRSVVAPAVRRPKSFPITDPPAQDGRLRVYMYDLPRKFTYGVIEAYRSSRGIRDGELKYPGTQHSAEWSLFSDLETGVPSGNHVRVYDPNDADVYYVPFFSSLSLVVNTKGNGNGKGGNGNIRVNANIGVNVDSNGDPNLRVKDNPRVNDNGDGYDDEETQEELMAWLEAQDAWNKNGGRDHVVIAQDPNAMAKLRDRLKKTVLLVSDFGRFKPDQASLVKDVVVPYTHRISSYVAENATMERKTLLFFMGNRYRKEGGKIRDQLFQLLEAEDDMVIKQGTQSRVNRRLASRGMRVSKFCLHPAGDTPSACRLFDAIVSVCVPVIVSDDIELPFEDELDYTEFSVFVSASKALEPGFLATHLRKMSDFELGQKQQRLREVRKYFEYDENGGAVDMIWEQVRKKLPLIRTMIHRDKRLVAERSPGNCSCICGIDETTTL